MSNNLTIKDIAKRAGVGTTTVSRVLNDHPYVSEDKRQKVLNAIDELDYRRNFSARWLRGTETGLIGFLTDEVATTPYAVDIIRGVQEAAFENEKVVMILNTGRDMEASEAVVEFLLERHVEGIIYAAMFHREVKLPHNIYQVPTVLANCFLADRSLPSAVPDEVIGGYRATRKLLEAGHRRIGFLNVCPPAIPAAEGRLIGYKQALGEFGVPFDESIIGEAIEDAQTNYDTTTRFLEHRTPPTAFFFGNDRTALTGYSAIVAKGLRIPEDIGVVGFDNQTDIVSNLIPRLTTVQLPHYEMGQWAFNQLLVNDDEDDVLPPQVLIDCPLIEHDST